MTNKPEDLQPESTEPELDEATETEVETPSEEESSDAIEAQIDAADADEEAAEDEDQTDAEDEDGTEAETEDGSEAQSEQEPESEQDEPEINAKPRPPAKLERLQKILAQAGIASRRKAEEMIEQGRVQVNGKVVTELGTKADSGRDHIRVDGKLLQGAERLRYFMLNKPKGFVTTVKDPEGRPTVMQFFEKMRERLYPVGRLDYMSEGLLLVTNDGELANRLTKAASGVEKTYLVKVAGQPTESELDILRGGVAIERGKPGTGRVRTSPARIRQVRQGDNPWYEVILIEGRNRELRKMFEEIGHFVEKIRRVGYGPLVLDQEPGNLRELQPDELDALRLAAEGKARTPKSKEVRRRNAMDAAGLPTVLPRPTMHPRPAKPYAKPFEDRSAGTGRAGEFRPKRAFGTGSASQGTDRPARPARSGEERFRPAAGRTSDRGPARGAAPARFGSARPASGQAKPSFRRDEGAGSYTPRPSRPAWQKDDRPTRPPAPLDAGATGESRPGSDRPRPSSAGTGRTSASRPFAAKPAWNKSAGRSDRPAFKRPAGPRREAPIHDEDLGPVRPPNLRIEEIKGSDRPSPIRSTSSRPSAPRSYSDRPATGRPSAPRPYSDRSASDRPRPSRPSSDRPYSSERGGGEAGGSERSLPRAYTTSSGKPRAGGARPSSKPGKPAGRSYGSGSGPRSASGPRSIDPRTGSGYRPAPGGKRSFDGPSAGSGSRPSRPYTPRGEGSSDRPTPHTKKFSGSPSSRSAGPRSESPRGERNSGTG
jgi:23S rRNA pseudouridine2605 synthase